MHKPRALADTGALLAVLDRNDRWHVACLAAVPELRFPVYFEIPGDLPGLLLLPANWTHLRAIAEGRDPMGNPAEEDER